MRLLPTIAALTIAFALAPHAAARGAAGRGSQAQEKQAGEQREAQGADSAVERSTAAEKSVVVSLCVSSGDVVVRGWDRAEVRARASDAGSLRLLTPNVQPATSVEVLVSQRSDAEITAGDCGTAGTLELSVPRGATVNVETRDGHVEVSDVAGARVHALSGDVDVRRVSRSVEVSCLSGDITLADSSGPAEVTTVSGDVEARNVRAASASDGFEAKSTSGDVTLEGVTHAQVRGTTVSGGVRYAGALARGGDYDFRTISGDVTLELPADSSFRLHAKVVMSGDILTDFPVRTSAGSSSSSSSSASASASRGVGVLPAPPPGAVVMPPPPPDYQKPGKNKPPKEPPGTRLDGTVGTGDAVVNLSSFSGSLYLRKR
jgi:Putative adhesin